MELAGLSALLAVADKKSFTAAAGVLRITPSAVSQAVRALEDRVGVRLVQRTTRSVGLTEAGERFVGQLRPALAGVEEAFAALGELRGGPTGTLRLNVPRVAYDHLLEPRLAAFLAAYPQLKIEIVLDDAFADIVASGCDAGIRLGESAPRDMIAVRIGPEQRIAIVGSPAYFAARGRPKVPRDLVHHECILYRARTTGVVPRWELTVDGKDIDVAVDGRVVLNDSDAMIRAARAGLGLAHVFECTVRDDLAAGRLVRVLEAYCPPFPGFYLYYPSRTHLAPKLQVLIDFLARKDRTRTARHRR